jgi:hypothetical protein
LSQNLSQAVEALLASRDPDQLERTLCLESGRLLQAASVELWRGTDAGWLRHQGGAHLADHPGPGTVQAALSGLAPLPVGWSAIRGQKSALIAACRPDEERLEAAEALLALSESLRGALEPILEDQESLARPPRRRVEP